MRIEQHIELDNPPESAWRAMKDVGLLVSCLPGASLTGPAVDGELPLRFDVRLGPIAASFVGTGRVKFDDHGQAGRFEGSAHDGRTRSQVKGFVDFAVKPVAHGSGMDVSVDYVLTGTLAQFGRGGLVRELAAILTADFARNLRAQLDASGVASAAAAQEGTTTGAAFVTHASACTDALAARSAAPLDARTLIVAALKARWRRIARRFARLVSARRAG
jgi:carbon monoxide dehydrogenase subunit G